MIPKYRTRVTLSEEGKAASIDAALTVVTAWLADRTDDPKLKLTEGSNSSNTAHIYFIRDATPEGTRAAVTFDRAIKEQAARWTTEIGLSAEDGVTEVFVQVGVELESPATAASLPPTRPPTLIRQLIEHFDVEAGLPLSAEPLRFSTREDAASLATITGSKSRIFPLVCVSVDPYSEKPLIDPTVLQKQLLGLAHVALVEKRASLGLKEWLEQRIGTDARLWSVYNGAVRVYWPDVDITDEKADPFRHPLWLPTDLNPHLGDVIFRRLAWDATHRRMTGWMETRDVIARKHAKDQRATEELLTESAKRYVDLSKEIHSLRAQLEAAADEVRGTHAQIESLKYKLREVVASNEALRKKIPDDHDDDEVAWNVVPYRLGGEQRDVVELLCVEHPNEAEDIRREIRELSKESFWTGSKNGKLENLGGGLYEYRVDTKGHWFRFFCSLVSHTRAVVVLHGYAKKQNQLSPGEEDTARKRLKTVAAAT